MSPNAHVALQVACRSILRPGAMFCSMAHDQGYLKDAVRVAYGARAAPFMVHASALRAWHSCAAPPCQSWGIGLALRFTNLRGPEVRNALLGVRLPGALHVCAPVHKAQGRCPAVGVGLVAAQGGLGGGPSQS